MSIQELFLNSTVEDPLTSKFRTIVNILLDFNENRQFMLAYENRSADLAELVLRCHNDCQRPWQIVNMDEEPVSIDMDAYQQTVPFQSAICIATFRDDCFSSAMRWIYFANLTNRQYIIIVCDSTLETDEIVDMFEIVRFGQYGFYDFVVMHIDRNNDHIQFYRIPMLCDEIIVATIEKVDADLVNSNESASDWFERLFHTNNATDLGGARLFIRSELNPPRLLLTPSSDGTGDLRVSGSQVYLSEIMGAYFNATFEYIVRNESSSIVRGSAEFYERFREHVYDSPFLLSKAKVTLSPYG